MPRTRGALPSAGAFSHVRRGEGVLSRHSPLLGAACGRNRRRPGLYQDHGRDRRTRARADRPRRAGSSIASRSCRFRADGPSANLRAQVAAPYATPGVLRLNLSLVIGIARRAAEIDGVALPHHSFAEIGHALGAAYGNSPAEAVLVVDGAIDVAALDQRGEPRLCCAAAGPGLAVGFLAGLA